MRTSLWLCSCVLGATLAACVTSPDAPAQDDTGTTDQSLSAAGDTCSANPIYDDKGKYTGCITYVNGHRCEHDTKGLTELGCKTYCDALLNPLPVEECTIEIEVAE